MKPPDTKEKDAIKKKLLVKINKDDLPLTIVYKGKRYILILTKNDKLILNKLVPEGLNRGYTD